MKTKSKQVTKKIDLNSDELLKKLGKRIKNLRLQKGYKNFESFAYDHNISRAQYGRYENGQDLRFSSLVKVINSFDITFKEFFSEGFE